MLKGAKAALNEGGASYPYKFHLLTQRISECRIDRGF